jgi:methionyl aminopeptidase
MPVEDAYIIAGRIAAKVREEAVTLIKPGAKIIEICEFVESRIDKLGGRPAFPCNISVNYIAAHDTASIEDTRILRQGDVVKLDLGVQVAGCLADTAITICLGAKYQELAEVCRLALEKALREIKEGKTTGEIGALIEATAQSHGFKPISNLGGHNIDRFLVHGGVTIPNVRVSTRQTFKRGGVYAIEPFLTTREGAGEVRELASTKIYSLVSRRRLASKELIDMEEIIWNRFRTLPFATRWLSDAYEKRDLEIYIRQLLQLGVLRSYPVLIEANMCMVAQFEHTIAITESGVLVLTA